MRILFAIACVWVLASCAGTGYVAGSSPCTTDPGGYDCEVERYMSAP